MNNINYWQDVMRAGAILGVVMALSSVLEHYVLFFSELSLTRATAIYGVEWLIMVAIYTLMLFFFARRRVAQCDPQYGMSFSQVLSYVILVSMFAGIMVGVANTLYIDAEGYALYIDGILLRFDQLEDMLPAKIAAEEYAVFEKSVDIIRSAEQPTIFNNIFESLNRYIIGGAFVGIIIAAIVRRDPVQQINEE